MTTVTRREGLMLLVGDIASLVVSLWITLAVRYFSVPSYGLFMDHLEPFSLLFVVWIAVFFIAGLYEKHTQVIKSRLVPLVLKTQIANSVIAVLFFYLVPFFGIAPKTNLFIYLVVSFAILLAWRMRFAALGVSKRQNAILVGEGDEMGELAAEINDNSKYGFRFSDVFDISEKEPQELAEEILASAQRGGARLIVADLENDRLSPVLPHLYTLMFSRVSFIDLHALYESIFDRVPLSIIGYGWFLENVSDRPKFFYDSFKRVMDIAAALILGVVSLPFLLVAAILIKLDDKGPLMSVQRRVGRGAKEIRVYKFRTMSVANDEGEWGKVENKITRAGAILRKTRIDELPQLWNVLRGDMSLVGPRPEFPNAVEEYSKQIPYYGVRHIIKPGLSGWAQIYHQNHPHHGLDVKETRNKLSYDLYYVKNRSLFLDIKVALRTIMTMLSRQGR